MTTFEASLATIMTALLAASAFFSGSETALFGLSEDEWDGLSQRAPLGARSARSLLRHPRSLLITILLGNMVVNVLFFVMASVLTLRASSASMRTVYAVVPLLALILLGEVAPKLVATGHRARWCALFAPALLAAHRAIAPIRIVLDSMVVEPAARLAGSGPPIAISADELGELLELNAQRGVIDPAEARLLDDVLELSALRAKDVMTPRVDIQRLHADAARRDAAALCRLASISLAPVCEGSLDQGVVGVLNLDRFFREAPANEDTPIRPFLDEPMIVPEQARLDQILEQFHQRRRDMAIVVDEHGAVAGLVTFDDIAKRLVRDSNETSSAFAPAGRLQIQRQSPNQWLVDGRLPVRDLAEACGAEQRLTASSVAGFITAQLRRIAKPGDRVRLGEALLEVKSMRGHAIDQVVVSLATPDAPEEEA